MPQSSPLLRAIHVAVFALAAAVLPDSAVAGTIGFRTDAEVKAGTAVDAKVTMTHTGDEAASDVRVIAELEGRSMDGERVETMQPKESHVWNFHLFDQIARGVYAIVLRARYADSNGYEFEVVSIANATADVQPGPRIFGSIEVPAVTSGGEAVASLVAKRPPGRTGDYDVELIVPSGLEVRPQKIRLEFNEAGRATASFQLKNKKLLTGTNVNIFGFVRGMHEGHPQVDTIRGTVRVSNAPARMGTPMFYEAAAALFALLVVLEGFAWATGRRRELA